MTPSQADQRIMISRQTLAGYADMTRAGQWPIADLPMMADEIIVLERIAETHPAKAEKVYRLAESWAALIEATRGKLN